MANNSNDLIVTSAIANNGATSARLLKASGVSESSLQRRVRTGQLSTPFKGVYIVEALRSSDSLLAATGLAYPAGAACRVTAAHLHGFEVSRPPVVQFLLTHGSGGRIAKVEIHETRDLPEADVEVVNGIRTTSPSRTICDLAPFLQPGRLRHVIETQLTRACPTADELVTCVQSRRRKGVSHVGRLAELLGLMLDDDPFPESMLELRLFEALASGGMTGFVRQFRPEWYDGIRGIVDAGDPIGKTIIEADGRRFRQVTQAHDNDRRRDRTAAAHGYLVIRVGYRELEQRRAAVVSEIWEIVTARRNKALDVA